MKLRNFGAIYDHPARQRERDDYERGFGRVRWRDCC